MQQGRGRVVGWAPSRSSTAATRRALADELAPFLGGVEVSRRRDAARLCATWSTRLPTAGPVASTACNGYSNSMKSNTKSSVTLPPEELRLVKALKARLRLKSNVDVVRRGLRLLAEATDRAALRAAYRRASAATRSANAPDLAELDRLSAEGVE
jgi:Arc/MetJ-type ribon-helix-helix transcriptional regulator